MFGYISVIPEDLTPEELTRYKSFYCGLCHSLGKRYGVQGKMTLSNDMTFLAVLLSSLYEPSEKSKEYRCVLHPLKTRTIVQSSLIDYAADMNLLLAYHKCLDDLSDDHSLRGAAGTKLLAPAYRRLEAQYPEKCRVVRECLQKTAELEAQNSTDIDTLCRYTGMMLGEAFAIGHDAWTEPLKRIGASLGSFIYLMDAYEDYDRDISKKRFNPLRKLHEQSDYEDFIRSALQVIAGEAAQALQFLPLEQDAELLNKIMYHGLWSHYLRIQSKREKAEAKEKL